MYLFIIAVLYRYIPTEQKESRQKVPFLAVLQWICIFLWTSALPCTAMETLWLGLCDVPNGCQAMTQSRHTSLYITKTVAVAQQPQADRNLKHKLKYI